MDSPKNPSGISIRHATAEDVAAILALYVSAGITGERAFSVEEGRAQLKHFARYPDYRVYVALIAQEVVGTYELLIMDNLAKAGAKSAIVEDVAVSPEHQGRGLGRALMEHAKAIARTTGCYKLVLSSNLKRSDAHAFYDALGFERHGISFRIDLPPAAT